MCKSWEDYSKNWMHFVYKLDHLFQSTSLSHENSSVTKTFHFSKLISTQYFFCIQHATFKATCWNFNHFWLHLLFFMHLMIFLAKWPYNLKALQPELKKGWNLALYHDLTHITCVRKLRGLRQKLDALRVQTGPSLSKYKGFHTKTHLLQRHFIFLSLFHFKTFFCIQHATFKATYWNFNPFWLNLVFFMHLMIYYQLNDLEIGKGYNLNSKKVETWHGIIIWPT